MKLTATPWTLITFFAIMASFALFGCKPDKTVTPKMERECTFEIAYPAGLSQASYSEIAVALKSNLDGKEVKMMPESPSFSLMLLDGSYKLIFTAKLAYYSDKLRSLVNTSVEEEMEVTVSDSKSVFKVIPQYAENASSGFVISEIYFSPTINAETNKRYDYREQYVVITNNSDVTLYADSLALIESSNLTNQKREYHNSILHQAMPIGFMYMIPGDGRSHPVLPGESIIIANDPKDHSKEFPGAANTSGADFEIYDLSSNPKFQDTDNLDVLNLIPYYKKSLTLQTFYQNGTSTVAIAKVPVSRETFAADYAWEGHYTFVFGDVTREMTDKVYQVPHAWLIDVVNLSMDEDFQWLFVPETLDAGRTGWRKSNKDNEEGSYGAAVIRKIGGEKEGRTYYQDTNNSTDDFNRRVTPSLKK